MSAIESPHYDYNVPGRAGPFHWTAPRRRDKGMAGGRDRMRAAWLERTTQTVLLRPRRNEQVVQSAHRMLGPAVSTRAVTDAAGRKGRLM